MDITKCVNGKNTEVTISGRLDTTTAPQLEEFLQDVYPEAENLVLVMNDLNYLSSAGLRVILATKKKIDTKNGDLIIRGANEMVMDVFNVTGFSDILIIE